jgi:hypothetical protein
MMGPDLHNRSRPSERRARYGEGVAKKATFISFPERAFDAAQKIHRAEIGVQ